MDDTLKHSKVTSTTELIDGSNEITTDSYYEKLSHTMVEIEKPHHTTRQALLKDLIEATAKLSEGSPKLTICIEAGHHNNVKVTTRWTVSKKSYNKL